MSTLGAIYGGLHPIADRGRPGRDTPKRARPWRPAASATWCSTHGVVDGHLGEVARQRGGRRFAAGVHRPVRRRRGERPAGRQPRWRQSRATWTSTVVCTGSAPTCSTAAASGCCSQLCWAGTWPRAATVDGPGATCAGSPPRPTRPATSPSRSPDHLLHPDIAPEWIDRWGPVATPLLWSHGMYLILADELGLLERTTQTVCRALTPGTDPTASNTPTPPPPTSGSPCSPSRAEPCCLGVAAAPSVVGVTCEWRDTERTAVALHVRPGAEPMRGPLRPPGRRRGHLAEAQAGRARPATAAGRCTTPAAATTGALQLPLPLRASPADGRRDATTDWFEVDPAQWSTTLPARTRGDSPTATGWSPAAVEWLVDGDRRAAGAVRAGPAARATTSSGSARGSTTSTSAAAASTRWCSSSTSPRAPTGAPTCRCRSRTSSERTARGGASTSARPGASWYDVGATHAGPAGGRGRRWVAPRGGGGRRSAIYDGDADAGADGLPRRGRPRRGAAGLGVPALGLRQRVEHPGPRHGPDGHPPRPRHPGRRGRDRGVERRGGDHDLPRRRPTSPTPTERLRRRRLHLPAGRRLARPEGHGRRRCTPAASRSSCGRSRC